MDDREQQRKIRHRLAVLYRAEEVTGNVAATCRCYGISRPTFYKWRNRYEELGPDGLRDRSSRPHHSPRATRSEVNGAAFQSGFHWHVLDRGIRHTYIKPAKPRLNGKVERSHRIDAEVFYRMLDGGNIGHLV